MTTARAHKRAAVKREIRAAKQGNARDAIGTLTPGAEIYVLTFGQFSLIDALHVLLEQTGPADVVLSTWTASDADLNRAAHMMETAQIRKLRMIVDRSFLTRQPDYCATMLRLFGEDCIRTTRSHCKFIAIRNDRWNIAVRTSMNLNENPRLENIEISDDSALCGFLWTLADEIYAEQAPGVLNGELPAMAGVQNVQRPGGVTMGAMARPTTRPSVGIA